MTLAVGVLADNSDVKPDVQIEGELPWSAVAQLAELRLWCRRGDLSVHRCVRWAHTLRKRRSKCIPGLGSRLYS
jgi:hypothetical protein